MVNKYKIALHRGNDKMMAQTDGLITLAEENLDLKNKNFCKLFVIAAATINKGF